MSTEAQFHQGIISTLLAHQRGEEPPASTIISADSGGGFYLSFDELPLDFTREDLHDLVQQQIAAHLTTTTGEIKRQARDAIGFLMTMVLELAEEYERACPDADTAGFIRDFVPPAGPAGSLTLSAPPQLACITGRQPEIWADPIPRATPDRVGPRWSGEPSQSVRHHRLCGASAR